MKIKSGALTAATLAAAAALLVFPAQSAAGAGNGVSYCLNILVPSLYPFMVLSVFVVRSGLSEKTGRLLEGFTQKALRLPGCTTAAVLMSVIGGFPTGARAVAALYEQGDVTEEQAGRMLLFCVNAGPPFVITAVGVGFLKDPRAGILLLTAQFIAFLLLAVLSGMGKSRGSVPIRKKILSPPDAAQALILSAADASASVLSMCFFVILFASLMNLLRLFVREPHVSCAVSALLEVTGGCSDLARMGAPLWVVAFAIGWGGICVHFQVFAFTAGIRYSRARFLLFRFLQGLFAAVAAEILSLLSPESVPAFSSVSGSVSAGLSGPAPASAALLLLCAAFLACMPRENPVRH